MLKNKICILKTLDIIVSSLVCSAEFVIQSLSVCLNSKKTISNQKFLFVVNPIFTTFVNYLLIAYSEGNTGF